MHVAILNLYETINVRKTLSLPVKNYPDCFGHTSDNLIASGAAVAQGATNRLAFTEGRLSFDFVEVTTRPESQAVRRLCGWPMILALTF